MIIDMFFSAGKFGFCIDRDPSNDSGLLVRHEESRLMKIWYLRIGKTIFSLSRSNY